MIQVDDPAEAPGKIARIVREKQTGLALAA